MKQLSFASFWSLLFALSCAIAPQPEPLLAADSGETSSKYEIQEFLDIPYYEKGNPLVESEEARLNLIIPQMEHSKLEHAPVFVWIGQGAWAYVSRAVEMNICRRFAEAGIVVVSAGHRLSPALLWDPKRETGVQHPAHVKDIAKALKWLTDNGSMYGFSIEDGKNRLFIGGYSSGAHLSALIAMDARYLEELGLSTDIITGIVPVAGGYDIPSYREALLAEDESYDENHILPVFGDHASQVHASPTTYLEHLKTSVLLISERDTYGYTAVFEEKLAEMAYPDVQVINLHNESHASLWRNLGSEAPSKYRNYIIDFVKETGAK